MHNLESEVIVEDHIGALPENSVEADIYVEEKSPRVLQAELQEALKETVDIGDIVGAEAANDEGDASTAFPAAEQLDTKDSTVVPEQSCSEPAAGKTAVRTVVNLNQDKAPQSPPLTARDREERPATEQEGTLPIADTPAPIPEASAGGGSSQPPKTPESGDQFDESNEEPKEPDTNTSEVVKVPSIDAIEIAGALQGVIADIPNRDFTLDVVQEETVQAIGGKIVAGELEGHIASATSSGKTLQIALLAEASVRAGKRVHIMAPTKAIADQIIGADGETGIGRFTKLLDEEGVVERNFDGDRGSQRGKVVVSTYSGFLNESKARETGGGGRLGDFHVVLGDECHTSLGTETSTALYRYMPGAIKVGFSATPDYAEDRKSEEIWGDRWFEFSLRDSIEIGKTAPTRSLLIATDSTINVESVRGDFTERELAPLIDNFERNGIALQMAQDFVTAGRQGIIACVPGQGNTHAIIMADLLSQMQTDGRNIIAKDVGSHLHPDEQRQRLQDYRDGKIDILTFTKTLEQGWDSKRASFCLNLSPTTSEVRTKQLMGRIGRVKESGLESIYVDFVDDKIGANRQQYTGAHALELDEVDIDRILGWGDSRSTEKVTPQNLSHILRPEIYERLMRVQGKTLIEALTSSSGAPVDPLVAQWERTLKREGMPEELPNNIAFTPALAQRYEQAAAMLRLEYDREPTVEEIAAHLEAINVPKSQIEAVRTLGTRIDWPETFSEIPEDNRESVEDVAIRLALRGALEEVVGTLNEREAEIVRGRFGFGLKSNLTGNPSRDELIKISREGALTLEQLGTVFGVNRERIRQIESKAMSKLRHNSRSQQVMEFATPGKEYERQRVAPSPTPRSPFSTLPGANIPLFDSEDQRPYITRVQEVASTEADKWLMDKRQELDVLSNSVLESHDYLKTVAASATPRVYYAKGKYYRASELPEDIDPDNVLGVYTLPELRAYGLIRQEFTIGRELQSLHALRERVISRRNQQSQNSSREATLTVIDERIRAVSTYDRELRSRIKNYLAESKIEWGEDYEPSRENVLLMPHPHLK